MHDWRAGLRLMLVLAAAVGMVGCRNEYSKSVHVPRTAAVRALEAATAALASGDVARARVKVEEAVAEDQKYYLAHGVHGMVLAGAGEFAAAAEAMARAVALEPGYGEGHLMRGVFLEQAGDRAAADAAYAEAVRVFDAMESATPLQHTCRAVAVYLRSGRVEGVRAVDAVVRDHPQFETAATVRQKMIVEDREFFLRWAASADQGEEDA